MAININNYTDNVKFKDGIYLSDNNRNISYPKGGNEQCFQIEKDNFWFKHRNNCITVTVKYYSPGDVFFDIGGGNGFVAKSLQDNNIDTVLVEPGIDGALNAKKRGLTNIICSTLEDVKFKPNMIMSIGLFDVIEHIEDDRQFLKTINSYLANMGLVYITVPAFSFLWSVADNNAGHYRRYTLKRIEKRLKNTGFHIEYSTYIFSILPFPIFFFRTIPSYIGLHKKLTKLSKQKKLHTKSGGIVGYTVNKIWKKEIDLIKKKKKIPFGGSCFIVARKISHEKK